jgi:hypothetical protein
MDADRARRAVSASPMIARLWLRAQLRHGAASPTLRDAHAADTSARPAWVSTTSNRRRDPQRHAETPNVTMGGALRSHRAGVAELADAEDLNSSGP